MGDGKSVAAAGLLWSPTVVVQGAKLGSKPTCPAAHHSSFKSNGPLLRENEGARFPGNNAGTCCFVIYLPPHLPGFQNCLLGKIHYEGNLRQFCTDCLGCRLKLKLSKLKLKLSKGAVIICMRPGSHAVKTLLRPINPEARLRWLFRQSRLPDTVPALFRDLQGANGMAWVSGVLARFRDIDFNGYRHCVSPNTPIEGVRNPARQYQSRDVKVGDNPTAQTLSFGKEIEEHTIQQGSVRVNNGMQQNVGELATQTSRYRKGNQGHRSERKRPIQVATNIIRPHSTETQYKASRVMKVNRRTYSKAKQPFGNTGVAENATGLICVRSRPEGPISWSEMGDGKSVAAAGLLWSPTVVVQGAKLGSKPTCQQPTIQVSSQTDHYEGERRREISRE
ncbi:hypothetical protein R3P38DRAFT_2814562 [Favolaschia claudopus]|uniref:Uncharacterized protein n=1 Tax=Favolaschia claudopus TaxID=2862362 RepID=A0AAV9Z365_9AGAR